jgi:hypothetical protein
MDLREIGLGVSIGFDWLRIGTGGGLLWVRWWTFGFLRHEVSYGCNKTPRRNFGSYRTEYLNWIIRIDLLTFYVEKYIQNLTLNLYLSFTFVKFFRGWEQPLWPSYYVRRFV